MKKWYLLVSLFFIRSGFSQDIPLSTRQQLEFLADASESDIEDDQLLQYLDYFTRNPLHLNTASREELQSLRLLSEVQISYLITYRELAGKLVDIHELQAIPGWDAMLIQKLLPYVTIHDRMDLKESFASRWRGEHTIILRASRIIEKAKGYDKTAATRYLGDPLHLMFRYRYQYRDLLYLGITGDKDAGEQLFRGVQSKGFDFYSFHFFLKKLGKVKSLAIGDYMVNLGQGLISWQSGAFAKNGDVMNIKRSAPVLMPYRSAGESNFYRGVGVTFKLKNLESSLFISSRKISSSTNDSVGTFTGINTSGYHRTPAEIDKRNQISQVSLGGNVGFAVNRFQVGINALVHRFSMDLKKRDEPYNIYAATGNQFINTGIDFSYTLRNFHVFGELAADRRLNYALVSGVLISMDHRIDVSFVFRSMEKNYSSIYGNVFSESTLPSGETGLFAGLTFRPLSEWNFNAYADLFRFPWLRFRVNAPGSGCDLLVQATYQPDKKKSLMIHFRNKSKPLNMPGDEIITYPLPVVRQHLRLHYNTAIEPGISFKSRAEVVWFRHGSSKPEQGFLGFVEADMEPVKRVKAGLRMQYFETAGFNSRIYAYEPDVMYGFSIPAFYDHGTRYLFNVQFTPSDICSVWLRWARSIFRKPGTTGSGTEEIAGHRKSEIRLQLRFIF